MALRMEEHTKYQSLGELELRIASLIGVVNSYPQRRLILITVDDKTKRVSSGTIQEAVTFVRRFLGDAKISHKEVFCSLYDEFGRVLNLFLVPLYQLNALRTELKTRRLTDCVNVFDLTPRWYRP